MKQITNFKIEAQQNGKGFFEVIRKDINEALKIVLAQHGFVTKGIGSIRYEDTEFKTGFIVQIDPRILYAPTSTKDVVIDQLNAQKEATNLERMEKMLGSEYRQGQRTFKLEKIEDGKFHTHTRRNVGYLLTLEQVLKMRKIS